jgi:signal transduction histidine kinase
VKRTVEKTVLTGFVVVLGLLGLVGLVSKLTISGLVEDSRWLAHTHRVIELVDRLTLQVTQAEDAARGFVITRDETYASTFFQYRDSIAPSIAELLQQTADNPEDQRRLREAQALLQQRLAIMGEVIAVRRKGEIQDAIQYGTSSHGRELGIHISAVLRAVRDNETGLLEQRDLRARRSVAQANVVLISAILMAMGAVVACIVLVFRDMKRRREVERIKTEFVSVVSHELRTPLTSIRGSLGLLSAGLVGDVGAKGQRMLEIAVVNTDRLIRLLNDVLDIQKLESGRMELRRARCEVPSLIEQSVDLMQPMAQQNNVTLRYEGVDEAVLADQDRILQCIANLLSNAIKFSPAGAEVLLRAGRNGTSVLFEVKDRGRGIPAEKLDAIFEPFQQVDASDSRAHGGSGLGLTISRNIVAQHGGRMWAESVEGVGSTFCFTLPLYKQRSHEPQEPGAAKTAVGMERGKTHSAD